MPTIISRTSGIVLDDEDRRSGRRRLLEPFVRDRAGRGLALRARKIDPHRRALADLALDARGATRLLGKSVDLAEAQTGAFADLLGGVERLERPFQHVGGSSRIPCRRPRARHNRRRADRPRRRLSSHFRCERSDDPICSSRRAHSRQGSVWRRRTGRGRSDRAKPRPAARARFRCPRRPSSDTTSGFRAADR